MVTSPRSGTVRPRRFWSLAMRPKEPPASTTDELFRARLGLHWTEQASVETTVICAWDDHVSLTLSSQCSAVPRSAFPFDQIRHVDAPAFFKQRRPRTRRVDHLAESILRLPRGHGFHSRILWSHNSSFVMASEAKPSRFSSRMLDRRVAALLAMTVIGWKITGPRYLPPQVDAIYGVVPTAVKRRAALISR